MMLDSTGGARAVSGLPGSLSVADPAVSGVVSLACAAYCLFKTDMSLIASGQSVPAPAGEALFAFDASGAFVYFPHSRQLARLQSGQLTPVDFNVSGEIISLRSVNGAPEFAVLVVDQIRIVRDGNVVVYQLPPGAQAAMLLPGSVVYSTASAIVLRRADASELSFPLTGANSFVAMGPDYIEIRTPVTTFGLRITPGREQLFQMPEPNE
jgi:hypothetical protein